jgi:hypothetical protein
MPPPVSTAFALLLLTPVAPWLYVVSPRQSMGRSKTLVLSSLMNNFAKHKLFKHLNS